MLAIGVGRSFSHAQRPASAGLWGSSPRRVRFRLLSRRDVRRFFLLPLRERFVLLATLSRMQLRVWTSCNARASVSSAFRISRNYGRSAGSSSGRRRVLCPRRGDLSARRFRLLACTADAERSPSDLDADNPSNDMRSVEGRVTTTTTASLEAAAGARSTANVSTRRSLSRSTRTSRGWGRHRHGPRVRVVKRVDVGRQDR
jgi:hypothetical protein